MFFSPLLVLAFSMPDVEAANTPKVKNIRIREVVGDTGTTSYKVISISGGTDTNYEHPMDARVQSDGGTEEVAFVEADAWLHGGAELKAPPSRTATATVTLYDTKNAELQTFAIALDGNGSGSASSTACSTKGACDTSTSGLDLEVLAAQVFPTLAGGYELTFDLAGADTYAVAYAKVSIADPKVTTCDKVTGCTTTGDGSSSSAEVYWDAIGEVWEADLTLVPEGLVEVTVHEYDVAGKKTGTSKVKLSGTPHFIDDWQGETMLASDDDPLTSVTLGGCRNLPGFKGPDCAVTVISERWTFGDTLPVSAQVEIEGGKTLTLPATAFEWQALNGPDLLFSAWETEVQDYLAKTDTVPTLDIAINGDRLYIDGSSELSLDDLSAPVCVEGTCIELIEEPEGVFSLAATAYTATSVSIPREVVIEVSLRPGPGDGDYVATETLKVSFDEEVGVLFANGVTVAYDPTDVGYTGKVSLLGAADKKGKQKTLSKGKFHGQFTRDDAGNLRLAGADKDTLSAKGDILIGGEPIGFELTKDTDGDGVINPPPVMLMRRGGTGTTNTANNTSQTQQAQLL